MEKKKELFRGVVEALQKGGMNKSEMSFFTGQSVNYIGREIERIKQCGPFSNWIIYKEGPQIYEFVPAIRNCPFDSIIYMIKHFYNLNKDKMDMKMDLKKKPVDSNNFNIDDFLSPMKPKTFDFSHLKF
jgi:hypothetical protein